MEKQSSSKSNSQIRPSAEPRKRARPQIRNVLESVNYVTGLSNARAHEEYVDSKWDAKSIDRFVTQENQPILILSDQILALFSMVKTGEGASEILLFVF